MPSQPSRIIDKQEIPVPFKIILVEDDSGHAALIKKNLQRSGIKNEILHINNGREAIACILSEVKFNNPMIVLLDLNLPIIDGYKVLETLKGDEKTRHIPIIILTTTKNEVEIQRCYNTGCNVYLTKPIRYEEFVEAIEKLGLILEIVKVP